MSHTEREIERLAIFVEHHFSEELREFLTCSFLHPLTKRLDHMTQATDALNDAVTRSIAEQKNTNVLLADVKAKLDEAIAGGNNDPLIQAAADALNAQTAEDQAAEAANTPATP